MLFALLLRNPEFSTRWFLALHCYVISDFTVHIVLCLKWTAPATEQILHKNFSLSVQLHNGMILLLFFGGGGFCLGFKLSQIADRASFEFRN